MCGRFVFHGAIETLLDEFPIDVVEAEVTANFNVAPTQKVLAVTHRDGHHTLERLRWGLIPFWAEDASIGNRMINARAETVREKPAFRGAFQKRRCLIPANGFFEWKREEGRKQPYYIMLADQIPFAFAGLWETWTDRQNAGETIRSCTILTTDACPEIARIHNRMPVILKPISYAAWLTPGPYRNDLDTLLRDGIQKQFKFHPVSIAVNSVRNNSPELIRPNW